MVARRIFELLKIFLGIVVFCILFAEVSLWVASAFSPMVDILTRAPEDAPPRQLPDARLGGRGNPDYLFHDARGFRNAAALDRADVVALGDSQTYGTGVQPDEAWPAVLARQTGFTVYSMSFGGYGATQANENLGTALSLKPAVVLFALYFGNDFSEDFWFAQRNDELASLISDDERDRIESLERTGGIGSEVGFLFAANAKGSGAELTDGTEGHGIFRELARWSRLAGFVHSLQHAFRTTETRPNLLAPDFETAVASLTERQKRYASPFDDGRWRTVLTAPYRLQVMDDTDPRVAVGQRITRRTIGKMAERASVAGVTFGVVMLPTKEFVFAPRATDPAAHPRLAALLETEARLHLDFANYMDSREIPYIDMTAALRGAPDQGYFVNADGHPNPRGHAVIASEVARFLDRLTD